MKADTERMRVLASEINSFGVQYQNLINKLYKKISNMPVTGEWKGNSADKYIKYVMLDKPDMISVGNKIKKISTIINDSATSIESNVSRVRKDEANE